MTTAVQHRRGTTAEHSTFTGLEGEVTIDTTKDTAVIHDGVLAGGYPLAKENLANVTTSGLSSIDGASTASDDKFFIYDQSATTLKTITRAELNNAIEQDALANVAITGGTINGTSIGGTTAAAGAFTTLTTSSTVTHNGGTANGVAYLNGSKVLTTGSALTFTSGKNLGVGTASPAASFHVNETDVSGTDITVSRFSTASGGVVNLVCDNLSSAQPLWTLQTGTGENLAFKQGTTEQMRLTSTGLGIGTSSPTNALSVTGNANITGNTTLGDASTDTVTVNGYMGVGGAAPNANRAVNVAISAGPTATTGVYGVYSSPTRTSAGNDTNFAAFNALPVVNAAALTIASSDGLYVLNSTVTAGTLTSQHGVRISDLTSATNNYGITSLVSSGSNKWNIYASGTAANYFAGNVGIGTSSPGTRLDVNGSTYNPLVIRRDGGTDANTGVVFQLATNYWNVGAGTDGNFGIAYNSTNLGTSTQFRITSAGNVGIGTSSPNQKLEIAATSPRMRLTDTDGGYAQIEGDNGNLFLVADNGNTVANSTLKLGVDGSTMATLDSSGNLGLGVTPSAWGSSYRALDISAGGSVFAAPGDNNQVNLAANAYNDNTNFIYKNTTLATLYRQNNGQHEWHVAPSGTAGTAISFTQAMTLDASGNLGVGRTNPNGRLHVQSVAGTDAAFYLQTGDATTNSIIHFGDTVDSSMGWLDYDHNGDYLAIGVNNAERMRIDSSGNVLVTGAGGLGYGTGSGGAVTQATSRTTGVTLNKTNGAITLVSAAGTTTWQTFTVTNSTVAATDTIIVNQKSGTDLYQIFVTNVAAGSFKISFATTGGTTTEQPVFNFAVIKAVTA